MSSKKKDTDKLAELANLTDPEKNEQWLLDIKNATRKIDVHEVVAGKTIVRGKLSRLLTYRVFKDDDGDRSGNETVEAPINIGGDWGPDLTDQAEEELYSLVYTHLSTTLRKRMTTKFDVGEVPDGTGLLRLVQEKTNFTDWRAAERKADKNYDDHRATSMSEGIDTAEMNTWCDKLTELNSLRTSPDKEHKLVQYAIEAFPESVVDKIENASESATHEQTDIDAMQLIWAGVLERTALRTARRNGERAMGAKDKNDPRDDQITELTKQVAALAKLVGDGLSGGDRDRRGGGDRDRRSRGDNPRG